MSESLSAGKEVLSYCNSCKASLAHIIEVMKGSVPHKVKCKTCKKTHVYKDPAKVNTTKTRAKRVTKKKKTNILSWNEAVAKANTPAKTYSPKEKFLEGDLIDHPTFGKGVVEKNLDSTKIIVLFENDLKTLVHGL
ncbi:MAG: hypothetical protein ACO20H_13435 [Bacteriovoracaceae bacterium]